MKIVLKTLVIVSMFVLLSGLVVACGSTVTGQNVVHMGENDFTQNTITIKKGESVTLANDDAITQHVIENGTWDNNEAKPGAESGAPKVDYTISGGGSQVIGPFNTAGTFKLYCTIHTGMNLKVIVK